MKSCNSIIVHLWWQCTGQRFWAMLSGEVTDQWCSSIFLLILGNKFLFEKLKSAMDFFFIKIQMSLPFHSKLIRERYLYGNSVKWNGSTFSYERNQQRATLYLKKHLPLQFKYQLPFGRGKHKLLHERLGMSPILFNQLVCPPDCTTIF